MSKRKIALIGILLLFLPLLAIGGPRERNHGWLGISMRELDQRVLEAFGFADEGGVLVTSVWKESPAAKAGIKKGDVILRFNGEKVFEPDDLSYLLRRTKPGQVVKIELLRKGKRITVKAKLTSRLDYYRFTLPMVREKGRSRSFLFFLRPRIGLRVYTLNPELATYFKTKKGALVLAVDEDSPAKEAGFKPGDVIVKAGGKEVTDIDDLLSEIERAEDKEMLSFLVIRRGKRITLKVKIKKNLEFHPREKGLFSPGIYRYDVEKEMIKKLNELKEELAKKEKLNLTKMHKELEELQKELELKIKESTLLPLSSPHLKGEVII